MPHPLAHFSKAYIFASELKKNSIMTVAVQNNNWWWRLNHSVLG